MNSKRGQSEIITTVLIILLVLAAIVIVWQVVRGTLSSSQTQITSKKDCLGLDMQVVKTTPSYGNCTNSTPAPGCVIASAVIGTCASYNNGTCTYSTFTETSKGTVLIRREGTSSTKGVKTQLLINDKLNTTSATLLDSTYSTDTYSISGLLPDTYVQISPLLADNSSCGLTEKVKVLSS